MTLKVIGAGFGRTGTLSLKLALEQLGLGQGWPPLCRFLGVPVPSTPMPKSNTREEFRRRRAAPPP